MYNELWNFYYSVQNRSLWNFQCHSLEELVPLTLQIISVGYIHSHKSIQEEQNSKPSDSSLPTNLQCGTVSKAFNQIEWYPSNIHANSSTIVIDAVMVEHL